MLCICTIHRLKFILAAEFVNKLLRFGSRKRQSSGGVYCQMKVNYLITLTITLF